MSAKTTSAKRHAYALLIVMETLAALVILTGVIPIYGAILAAPGHPLTALRSRRFSVAAVALFQCVYWFRILRVPVAVRRHSLVLSHLTLFASRLSFVFGTALFVLIIVRHIPALQTQSEALPPATVLVARAVGVLVIMFSLYCYSTELERLGLALQPARHR